MIQTDCLAHLKPIYQSMALHGEELGQSMVLNYK